MSLQNLVFLGLKIEKLLSIFCPQVEPGAISNISLLSNVFSMYVNSGLVFYALGEITTLEKYK